MKLIEEWFYLEGLQSLLSGADAEVSRFVQSISQIGVTCSSQGVDIDVHVSWHICAKPSQRPKGAYIEGKAGTSLLWDKFEQFWGQGVVLLLELGKTGVKLRSGGGPSQKGGECLGFWI